MKSPLIWYGGKFYMIKNILPLLPPHDYYLEVFGGAGHLLFSKSIKFDVYNDIHSGLTTFFKVLKDKDIYQEFIRQINFVPYSRELYEEYREDWRNNNFKDDIDKAVKFFFLCRASFSGKFLECFSYVVKKTKKSISGKVSSYLSAIEYLPEVHHRLQKIQVENLDWKECCEKYNDWGQKGFIYFDPPYVLETRKEKKVYQYEFTDDQHREMIDWIIKECKCKVMVSGYESEIYQILEENGFKRMDFEINLSAINEKDKNLKEHRRTECIWINYDLKSDKLF